LAEHEKRIQSEVRRVAIMLEHFYIKAQEKRLWFIISAWFRWSQESEWNRRPTDYKEDVWNITAEIIELILMILVFQRKKGVCRYTTCIPR